MLTCKSLFGLGYRGERLIEPSDIKPTMVVKSATREGGASHTEPDWRRRAGLSWQDRQIAGTRCQAIGRAVDRGNLARHPD